MKVFCLKCKTETDSENEQETYTNNRRILKCVCLICGGKKCKFLKKIAGGDIVDVIGKTVGEVHFPGSNFLGPGTRFVERIKNGDKPTDRVDEAAMYHDLAYHVYKDKEQRHEADRNLLKAIDDIKNPTFKERVKRATTKAVIKPKLFLGLGLEEAKYKDNTENLIKKNI